MSSGSRPSNRQAEVDVVRMENPWFSPGHRESGTNPKHIDVVVNIRESAVAALAARGVLDAAQVAAAHHFRRIWEAASGVSLPAQDPARIYVDGGGRREPLNVRQANADAQLQQAKQVLGVTGFCLCVLLCGERRSLHEICRTRRERDTAADLLRIHLDTLAALWRLRTKR